MELVELTNTSDTDVKVERKRAMMSISSLFKRIDLKIIMM